MDRVLYPSQGPRWDDAHFRAVVGAALAEARARAQGHGVRVLDLGAGAGIHDALVPRGDGAHVVGVDPDPRVLDNPHLDEGQVGSGDALPFEPAFFDLVVANNVVEHLDAPEAVFAEVFRVLRPGGRFLFKTPNRFHYVPLLAQLTPMEFHRWVNRRRGRADEDTFKTRYAANRPAVIRALAARAGFDRVRIELLEGRPEYLRFSPPTYLLGWAWERMVNGVPGLATFRVLIVAELRRPT